MSPAVERPLREAVLDAFAVEPDAGRVTLERYLYLYPEHAGALVDLSRELNREIVDDTAPLSTGDRELLDAAWSQHASARQATIADPFASLTIDDWRSVAQRLDVPRQVVTALRERRVSIVSVPRWILRHLAEAARSTTELLEASWGAVPLVAARAYKADGKPSVGEQVSLEQVLIEAGVTPEKRATLLADRD